MNRWKMLTSIYHFHHFGVVSENFSNKLKAKNSQRCIELLATTNTKLGLNIAVRMRMTDSPQMTNSRWVERHKYNQSRLCMEYSNGMSGTNGTQRFQCLCSNWKWMKNVLFIESVNLFKLLGIFLSSPHLFGCNWNEEEKVRINIIQSLKQFLCHRIKFSSE